MNAPVYVDSPLAISATQVFKENEDLFDDETKALMERGDNPLEFPGLKFTQTADESKALNEMDEPSIIISASGMCEVGRIKHHLKHNIWNPKSTILFVGYQAPGTLGRTIVDGAKTVKIFGEEFSVKARIEYIEGYSGHADQEWLLNFVYSFIKKPKHIFLVHGEPEAQLVLKNKIVESTQIPVTIPSFGEKYTLNDELTVKKEFEEKIDKRYMRLQIIDRMETLQEEIEDANIISDWLSSIKKRKVNVVTPKKGTKEKLVELAYKNAQMVLIQDGENIKREQQRTIGAMKEMGELLGLSNLRRAEAYDISNTNGIESVGSMVVFEDGKPKKNDYRKFKIKTVKGPDDYSSMREVLTRRFKRAMENSDGFAVYPDIIMMDGGRGQVNVALEVLKELKLNIPVCGMVKDDNHNTRGLYYNNVEIPIDKRSEGFKLITRVQDEAHRFAIEYHRSLRGKAQVNSVLDNIEGIGPVRRKALMKKFLDIEKIRNATVEELMQADGITENVAINIYKYFH